jgi:deoxycytidylate deaminase
MATASGKAVSDEAAMQAAIQLSERAGLQERTGRCFGAVVVKDGQIVGQGFNQVCATPLLPTHWLCTRRVHCSSSYLQLAWARGSGLSRTGLRPGFNQVCAALCQLRCTHCLPHTIESPLQTMMTPPPPRSCDPTWHAEMQAIREACRALGTPSLPPSPCWPAL